MCFSDFQYFVVFSAQNCESQQTITSSNSTIEIIKNSSNLKIKTPQQRRSITPENIRKLDFYMIFSGVVTFTSVVTVNIEHISHLFLVFLLLALNT